jgi:DnaJ-domain-containing protein 1
LRLEERCHQALAAVDALVDFLDQYLPCMERVNYSWLTKETDTIHRTIMSKDMGDSLFRTGDYLGAVAQYSACILIDCEDRAGNPQDVGGRLNAVLHCNRAAANMSLSKYREAISDCSAALHIHSLYMKAMLRRSRCYVRLNRFEEAQAELLRYINLVETAHAAGASSTGYQNTPCIFDAPKDIGADDLETARGELKELQRAKINAEHAKRAEEAERVNKQKRYQETFGQSKADAEQRRQQWYNQQDNNSSRRWDSFSGRGPHRGPHPGANPNHSYKQSSPNRGSYRARPEPPRAQSYRSRNSSREEQKPAAVSSPITETTSCHYKVLNVPRDASLELIKKAYKKAALKYHPDKNRGDNSATDLFRRARLAWEVLKDPVQKRSYDQELRWGGR